MASILIVSALEEEVKYFIRKIENCEKLSFGSTNIFKGFYCKKTVYLLITGIGYENVKINLGKF